MTSTPTPPDAGLNAAGTVEEEFAQYAGDLRALRPTLSDDVPAQKALGAQIDHLVAELEDPNLPHTLEVVVPLTDRVNEVFSRAIVVVTKV